jgi:hypothetical protein
MLTINIMCFGWCLLAYANVVVKGNSVESCGPMLAKDWWPVMKVIHHLHHHHYLILILSLAWYDMNNT